VILLGGGVAAAQFGLPGLPQLVVDVAANAKLATELIHWGTLIAQEVQTGNWLGQFYTAKAAWAVLFGQTLDSQAANQFGEMAQWSPAMASGMNTTTAWSNATVQLQPMQPILQGQPLGIPAMAQLATIEAINATGTNNLATVGRARSYLGGNVNAMQALFHMIQDTSAANNGPTQQMSLVAHATAQNTSIEVQNLQVQTSVLETVTVLAKAVGDSHTADLNLQAKKALTYQAEQVLPGGYGSAFMNHP
jgi:hypothetical protein